MLLYQREAEGGVSSFVLRAVVDPSGSFRLPNAHAVYAMMDSAAHQLHCN